MKKRQNTKQRRQDKKMVIYKRMIHKMKNLKKNTKTTNRKTSRPMRVLYSTFCTTRMFVVNFILLYLNLFFLCLH